MIETYLHLSVNVLTLTLLSEKRHYFHYDRVDNIYQEKRHYSFHSSQYLASQVLIRSRVATL